MNTYDLLTSDRQRIETTCDVCIIGAGAAGLYLATRLVAKGFSVVLLEAGGAVCVDGNSFGTLPKFGAELYPGATLGRSFGLGGSTSRWGGVLIPHSQYDVRNNGQTGFDAWQAIVATVNARTQAVLTNLGLGQEDDFASLPRQKLGQVVDVLKAQGLETTSAMFLPFRRRNLSYLLARQSNQKLSIYLNAVCTSFQARASDGGLSSISEIEAKTVTGNAIKVQAKQIVIAAGAIESARILLELRKSSTTPVVSETAAIGCYLADHLSCRIADVNGADAKKIAVRFGPRFKGGLLRSFRFLEKTPLPHSPRWFAHFIYDIDNPAFRLAKEWLLSIQSRRRPNLGLADYFKGVIGLFSFAYAQYLQGALYIPNGTPVHLQLDIEQVSIRQNAVELADELDQHGRPIAKINWRVTEEDYKNIQQAAEHILKKWPTGSTEIPVLSPVFINGNGPKPHDAYHPVGTCRMGTDAEAVVDPHLRVCGTENLWVLSTGVLPSAGTANPTFTMLCLGDAMVDQLEIALK